MHRVISRSRTVLRRYFQQNKKHAIKKEKKVTFEARMIQYTFFYQILLTSLYIQTGKRPIDSIAP